MRLEEKLKTLSHEEIWQEYCGFLDLSIDEFMDIQCRLLQEQIDLLSKCGLGQRFFKGKVPQNVDEFRKMVPLTTYEDYAPTLLSRQTKALPEEPVMVAQHRDRA